MDQIKINNNLFDVKSVYTDKDISNGMMNKTFNGFDGMLFFIKPGDQSFWMKNCLIDLDIIFISNTHEDFLTLSKLDLSKFKMQQFTGVFDRNKNKIYFGDTLRFADKVEWYRGEYWSKVALGIMSKKQALEEIEAKPYEERLIEENQDFEWLLSSEIQSYWEVVL